ncbi:MAG: glycosyltransferase [Betaproteobacteria bacterium]
MRFIIPNFRAPDSFTDNVADTLIDMGHDVFTMPHPATGTTSQAGRFMVDVSQRLFPKAWSEQERWLVKMARQIKPDVILAITQHIKDEVIAEAKKVSPGLRAVAWWGDPPANLRGMNLLTKSWDVIFAKDPNLVRKLQWLNLNAHLLHEAMNPKWHYPGASSRSGTVVVAGTYYGFRQALVKRLGELGVPLDLYGVKPPRWADKFVATSHSNRYIIRDEKSRIFSSASVNLNSMTLSEGMSLNCRAFEICGAGGFQLIESKEIIETCFEPGREVICFNSIEAIIESFNRVTVDLDWWQRVKEAGQKRAISEHTYTHRLSVLLSHVS